MSPLMALYQHHFLSPSTSFNFSFSPRPKKLTLKRNFHQSPVHGGVIYAFSAEKPSRKKGRPSRAVMSDEDLCKQLREVMSVAGLPADRVPLMKELCEHGRILEGRELFLTHWKQRYDFAALILKEIEKVLESTTNFGDIGRKIVGEIKNCKDKEESLVSFFIKYV